MLVIFAIVCTTQLHSLVIMSDPTDPSILQGIGTWIQFAEGLSENARQMTDTYPGVLETRHLECTIESTSSEIKTDLVHTTKPWEPTFGTDYWHRPGDLAVKDVTLEARRPISPQNQHKLRNNYKSLHVKAPTRPCTAEFSHQGESHTDAAVSSISRTVVSKIGDCGI
ncbi:hypothetical protein F5B20DRAFT_545980 [Whalleya microplaca]|nr:hypothetical protein F5B20DRAFT_545980 [Whalleya microplaca]